MSQFWTPLVQRLTPYVPGEQRTGDNIVKLNTNENPYPPSQRVFEAIASVNGDALRRYPDPESLALRDALAQYHAVQTNQVMVGNGSDELLALAFLAFFSGENGLQYPEISYSFYPVYCGLFGIEKKPIALNQNFEINIADYDGTTGVVLPNPNAPTGVALSLDAISELCNNVKNNVVLIDEAYVDFASHSAITLINKHTNLLVVQTFSKSRSLAGMRVGMAYGHEQLIEGLNRVKNSFNSYPLDAVAQAAAVASIADEQYYQHSLKRILDTRARTVLLLESRGYRVLPSSANFIFASPSDKNAAEVFSYLRRQGVLVRYWDQPLLSNWLRISIGSEEEMDRFFSVLDSAP